ncbi:DNA replication factor C complex subunit 1 [Volvox carteri f. nagariensis]|uniref:Replication factor C subunit 1 n=1 Tax=Volvox carteri f. nagariensis TaxID=3068 RepID=D8UHI8_VOLCA|nr:DNA replication factor C complex subunit 1 [Volvox carteri f. nagariensis]EFJ40860.1 DNA replication factor C complex subunit 1 [Volvox carteri f. nagariensis]|eukprot:XP_002958129.1 DNA replication factor C complex subunit 1 [Volvox carteri f. nagariensis]
MTNDSRDLAGLQLVVVRVASVEVAAAPAAKRRRVIGDDDDDDAVMVGSSSDDDDDDFEDLEDEQSSGSMDEDVAMLREDAAGGSKRKQGVPKPSKLTGTKRSLVVADKPVVSPKAAKSAEVKAADAEPSAKKTARVSGAAAGGSARKSAASSKKPASFSLDPNADAAIAAVSKAAEQLPPEEQLNFSLVPEGADAAGNDSAEPPNYRKKEVPRGHPDCLTGRTFVITGILDSLMRPEAEDLIKRHGGKVTKSVSGKTAFVVVGHNCGRGKYRDAKQHKTKLIDEDGLFALLKASASFAPAERPAAAAAAAAIPSSICTSNFGPTAAARAGPGGAGPSAVRKPTGPYTTPQPSQPPAGGGGGGLYQLWVDKYKPRNSSELVGNNTLVANLKQWLESWEQVHLRGAAAPTAKGGGSKPKDLSKKAALLSGPPGIGKTSAAHIIAREAGFEVVEMNASDTRNKSTKVSDGIAGKQSNVIKEMVSNTTLPGLGDAGGKHRKQLLIMDEVDGMSGGDRGGIQDLIDTIKRSKIPIICICNDKYNQKLRSLRNHCMELEFRKPTVQQISKRMSEICQKEGLQINQATMDALVSGAGGDLRLILGQLQMVRLRARALTYDEVRGKMGTSKDTDMSPFECARRLLEPACSLLSMGDRMELVFADMDLVPLLVQENYVNHRPTIAPDLPARLRAMAKAADSISFGDVVNNTLRRSQNWSLMPFAAVMSCLLPVAYMRGPREIFGLYPTEMNFPSAVRLEYASALRRLLVRPLVREQEAAVPAVVELMHGYCIDREQFDFILDVTSFKSKAAWAEDMFKDVPTKVKSAFTRSLNSTAPAARCLAQVEEVKLGRGAGKGKGKGRKAAAEEDDEEGPLEGEDAEQEAKPVERAAGEGGGQGEQEDEEDVDPATLARRLAKDGLVVQLQDDGKGTRGKKGGGRGGGNGAAKASGAGRGGGAGRGAGRGAGKAAAKK